MYKLPIMRPQQPQSRNAARRVPFMDAVRGTRVRTNLRGGTEVDIPPGIDNGGMIRMPGLGGPPPRQFEGAGEPGDLLLQARWQHLRLSSLQCSLCLQPSCVLLL
jgi:hypothetical protein